MAVPRRIMTTDKKKHPPPFSLRLTLEERQQLERQSGTTPLGAYIRERLFGSAAEPRRTRGKFPVKDHKALSQLLAQLGKSGLGATLRQLARSASSGSLPVTPETEAAICQANTDIAAMKRLLMAALGIQED